MLLPSPSSLRSPAVAAAVSALLLLLAFPPTGVLSSRPRLRGVDPASE